MNQFIKTNFPSFKYLHMLHIQRDVKMPLMERAIYSLLVMFQRKGKGASKYTIGSIMNLHHKTVSRAIKSLTAKGFVTKNGTKQTALQSEEA